MRVKARKLVVSWKDSLKFTSNSHISLSYSLEIKTINTFIHSRSFLENHTRLHTRFQTETNHTLLGGTYLYGLGKGAPRPGGGGGVNEVKWSAISIEKF